MHFERSTVVAAQGRRRPAAQLRIRQMMHPFNSEERDEHLDAGAAGSLLLVHTRQNGWHEWRRYLDRKSRTALSLLRDMPEGTEF